MKKDGVGKKILEKIKEYLDDGKILKAEKVNANKIKISRLI